MLPDTLTLPPFFSDHCVLQRGRPIPVFGSDRPGTLITVELNRASVRTRAAADGSWRADIPAMAAGGPYVLTVNGTREVRAKDVLIGEVWVASGQSNMEWTIDAGSDMQDEKVAPPSTIRMLKVQSNATLAPTRDLRGTWTVAASDTVGNMSAVGYSFARELERTLKVPVGILSSNWGGTPAESWTSLTALKENPVLSHFADQVARSATDYPAAARRYLQEMAAYQERLYPEIAAPGEYERWAAPDLDESGWTKQPLPHIWPADLDGIIWYRITVDLTPAEAASTQTLHLGPIDDADVTYINGIRIGSTTMTAPEHWRTPRNYAIPSGTLKPGRNVIAVRVIDFGGDGGFTGQSSDLRLGDRPLTAAVMKVERRYATDLRTGTPPPQAPAGPGNPSVPSSLFNGMIEPLIPYGIRGVIWYQGESNAGRAEEYATLFPTMIQDWRTRWKIGDFPFLFVGLANWLERRPSGWESAWAELRESQRRTLALPNTGMAVAIDVGDAKDIHPHTKRPVGQRLALHALAKTYGIKGLITDGPHDPTIVATGRVLRLTYRPESGLKTTDGRDPVGFAIAGEDRKFVVAEARIVGNSILLTAPGVDAPRYVRYAWADNPEVNLVGRTGLPAVPFRSDPRPYDRMR